MWLFIWISFKCGETNVSVYLYSSVSLLFTPVHTISVWLDKTLIHCLVSFIALLSCIETVILTFNRLESIEVH